AISAVPSGSCRSSPRLHRQLTEPTCGCISPHTPTDTLPFPPGIHGVPRTPPPPPPRRALGGVDSPCMDGGQGPHIGPMTGAHEGPLHRPTKRIQDGSQGLTSAQRRAPTRGAPTSSGQI